MKSRQDGSILVAILIMMPFFMLISIAYLQLATIGFRVARQDQFHTHAQLAADAAIDFSMQTINQDATWLGTGSEVPLHNDGNIRTSYEVVVNPIDADNKTIVATGRTYFPASSTTAPPVRSVTVETKLRPVRSGEYSVVSGVGGLLMDNHAKILGGVVHINGKISMKNHAQIGHSRWK